MKTFMKKRLAILLALSLGTAHTIHSTTLPVFQVSLMDRCKFMIASALATATASVLEMAATTLTMQGDPIAAEVLIDIQKNKPLRQLFCEAETLQITDMFKHLVSTLNVAPAVKTTIENAIYSAIYKAMDMYSKKWF